jgi:hypothetical protein
VAAPALAAVGSLVMSAPELGGDSMAVLFAVLLRLALDLHTGC